jgi:hypothetical protein
MVTTKSLPYVPLVERCCERGIDCGFGYELAREGLLEIFINAAKRSSRSPTPRSTVLARIDRDELEQLLCGYGWTPYFVVGSESKPMHRQISLLGVTKSAMSWICLTSVMGFSGHVLTHKPHARPSRRKRFDWALKTSKVKVKRSLQ